MKIATETAIGTGLTDAGFSADSAGAVTTVAGWSMLAWIMLGQVILVKPLKFGSGETDGCY